MLHCLAVAADNAATLGNTVANTPSYLHACARMPAGIMLPGFSAAGFIPALMMETELFVR